MAAYRPWMVGPPAAPRPGGRSHGPGHLDSAAHARGVAQPGSAPALGAGGPGFKSRRPDQLSRQAACRDCRARDAGRRPGRRGPRERWTRPVSRSHAPPRARRDVRFATRVTSSAVWPLFGPDALRRRVMKPASGLCPLLPRVLVPGSSRVLTPLIAGRAAVGFRVGPREPRVRCFGPPRTQMLRSGWGRAHRLRLAVKARDAFPGSAPPGGRRARPSGPRSRRDSGADPGERTARPTPANP